MLTKILVMTFKPAIYFLSLLSLTGCIFAPQINKSKYSKQELYAKIASKEHTSRKSQSNCSQTKNGFELSGWGNQAYYTESALGVLKLNDFGFDFASQLYDFLQKKENLSKVTGGLELSVKKGVEYGGYIDSKNNTIDFVLSSTNNQEKQVTVVLPLTPIIGLFHYHANKEDCTELAGPSDIDLQADSIQKGIPGIVITKLKNRNFNVDLFLGTKHPIIIDMGNYSY